jgi:hypothetical protein
VHTEHTDVGGSLFRNGLKLETFQVLSGSCTHRPGIPALRETRQEDEEFKTSLDYNVVRPCVKKKKKRKKKERKNKQQQQQYQKPKCLSTGEQEPNGDTSL